MGDMEDVTAATLSKEADMQDAEREQKRGATDYTKLEEQIATHKASAQQVCGNRLLRSCHRTLLQHVGARIDCTDACLESSALCDRHATQRMHMDPLPSTYGRHALCNYRGRRRRRWMRC